VLDGFGAANVVYLPVSRLNCFEIIFPTPCW
jgi:hypothetical protein